MQKPFHPTTLVFGKQGQRQERERCEKKKKKKTAFVSTRFGTLAPATMETRLSGLVDDSQEHTDTSRLFM